MAKVAVYQFTKYDIGSYQVVKSRPWRRARQSSGSASVVGREVEGLSDIGYYPHAIRGLVDTSHINRLRVTVTISGVKVVAYSIRGGEPADSDGSRHL
jgi:hypothetical protein